MKRSILSSVISVAISLPGIGWGGEDDSFAVVAGLSERYDSNLFRLSSTDKENAQRLLGEDKASDLITTGYGELKFDQTYSLQHVQLQAKVSRYRYQTFNYLNFTGTEYDGTWGWSLTPRFKGAISASRQQQPENYSDYSNFSEKNVRLTEAKRFSLDAYLFGSWFLVGGLGQSLQKNSATFREEDDYQQHYSELGLKFGPTSGNSITVLGRTSKGEYTDRDAIPQLLLDDQFTQTELETRIALAVFDKSRLLATVTQFEREHDQFSDRDYSGTNWSASFRWDATAKLFSTISASKRYDSYQDLFNSYVVTNNTALNVGYVTSAKSNLNLTLRQAQRDFRGGILPAPYSRNDTVRSTELGWAWHVSHAFSFMPAISYQRRTSLLPEGEYDAFGASLTLEAGI